MNNVKFRPVGKSGPIVVIRCGQYGPKTLLYRSPRGRKPTPKEATERMDRAGYVRAGRRAK